MPPFDAFPFKKKQEEQKSSRQGATPQPKFELPKEASLYGEAWGDPPGTTAETYVEQMQQERQTSPQRRQNPWGNLSDLNDAQTPSQGLGQRPIQPQQASQTQQTPQQKSQNPWGNLSDLNNSQNSNQNFHQPQKPTPPPQKPQEELSFEELHRNAQMKLMGTTLPKESQNKNMSVAERKKILSQPIDIDKIIAQTSGNPNPAPTPKEPARNSKETLQALLLNTPQKSQEPTQPSITQPQFEQIRTKPEPTQPNITQPQFEQIRTKPEPTQPQPMQQPTMSFANDVVNVPPIAPPIAPSKKRASFGGILSDEVDASSIAPPKRTATFGVFADEDESPIYQTKTPKKKSGVLGGLGKLKKEKQEELGNDSGFQLRGQEKGLLSGIHDSVDYVEHEPLFGENHGFQSLSNTANHITGEPILNESNGHHMQQAKLDNEVVFPSAQVGSVPITEQKAVAQPLMEETVNEPEKSEDITAYVNRVCSFVRWRKARKLIRQELEDHIYDQRDHYIGEGDTEADATYEALLQMGDAELVGRQYHATHRPKEQAITAGALSFLFVFGLYMQLFLVQTQFEPSYKEFFYHGAALLAFLAGYFMDFSMLGRYARWLTPVLSIVPAVLLGIHTLGESPDFGEIFRAYATFIFPLAYALLIYATQKTGHRGLIVCLIGYLYFCALLFFYEMYANILLFSCIAFVLLHYAVSRRWYGVNRKRTFATMTILATGFIAVAVAFIDGQPDLLDRIRIVFYPSIDPTDSGYLYMTIQDIIASCNLFTSTRTLDAQMVYTLIEQFPLTYLATKTGLWVLPAVAMPIIVFLTMATLDLPKQKTVIGGLLLLAVCLPILFQSLTFLLNTTGKLILDSYFPMVSYGLYGHIFAFGGLGLASSVSRIGYLCQDTKRKFAL